MSLSQVLESNNLTAREAWDFITVNIDSPATIFQEANNAGLTVEMLSELVAQFDSGISAEAVNEYFTQAGLNPADLSTVDVTPPSEPASNEAVVGANSDGVIVVDPVGPLNEQQSLFIMGLLESSALAFVPGDEAGVLLNDVTQDGLYINVRFGDTDFTDLIFTLEPEDYETLSTTASQALDNVYLDALQQAGYSSFDDFSARGNDADYTQIVSSVENAVVNFTLPQYEAMFAGQSDLWNLV